MKLTVAALITVVLLSMACKVDYDIEEVAAAGEHMVTDNHDECEHEDAEHAESDHAHDTDTPESDSEHVESSEHDASAIGLSDRHVHGSGERNHGTGWFFNQPWAASFIWGKMIRDIVILFLLSAAIVFASVYRRKRK